jgi:hypothetical protein
MLHDNPAALAEARDALPLLDTLLLASDAAVARRAALTLYWLKSHVPSLAVLGRHLDADPVLLAVRDGLFAEGMGGASAEVAPLLLPLARRLEALDQPLGEGTVRSIVRACLSRFPPETLTPIVPLLVRQFLAAEQLPEVADALLAIRHLDLPENQRALVVAKLADLLRQPEADRFRELLLHVLGRLGPAAAPALPALQECMARLTVNQERVEFADVLARIGTPTAHDWLRVNMLDLLRLARSEVDPQTRRRAAYRPMYALLGAGAAGRYALRSFLADAEPVYVRLAAEMLLPIADERPHVWPVVLAGLTSADPAQMHWALDRLVDLSDPFPLEIWEQLVRTGTDPATPATHRELALALASDRPAPAEASRVLSCLLADPGRQKGVLLVLLRQPALAASVVTEVGDLERGTGTVAQLARNVLRRLERRSP